MGQSLLESRPETQLDRIEQLVRELHRDLRMLKQEVAHMKRVLAGMGQD